MKHWISAALAGALTLVPLSAAAQTPTPSSPPAASPSVNLFYIGGTAGLGIVEHVGGAFGVEGGARVWKNLDLVGELTWMTDVVRGSTVDQANIIAGALEATQGQPASSSVKVPAFYAGLGARWVFENVSFANFRPYVIVTFGGTHTDIQSTFTLGGADVTNSLPQYGVTLGSDLTGKSNDFTVSPGVGLVRAFGSFYGDVGVRLVSIATSGQQTNVTRVVFGGGYKF